MSIQQLPAEVLRQIFDELFHINEAYRWVTPRLRYLEWMTVCKSWHSLMVELLYRSVQLEDLEQLNLFSSAIKSRPRLARRVETFHLRDFTRSRVASAAFTRIPFTSLRSVKLINVHIQKVAPRFFESASTVTHLELTDVNFATGDSLSRFIKCFKRVKELSIKGVYVDDATVQAILRVIGSKLETITIEGSVWNIHDMLVLLPNVKRLDLDISRTVGWTLLSPDAIPQGCEEIRLQCRSLSFVMNMLGALSERTFLPALKEFPHISWSRRLRDRETPSIAQWTALKTLKQSARMALVERKIEWTEKDSCATILDGTRHRLAQTQAIEPATPLPVVP